MSRAPGRKSGAETRDPGPPEAGAQATFLDAIGEPPFHPPADVNETPDGLVIRMEVPGVRAGEIEVSVQGNLVEVSGEKRRDVSCGEASFLCLERSFGRFSRVFELAGCLNMRSVTAVLRDGVLAVRVAKCDERRGHRRTVAVTEVAEP